MGDVSANSTFKKTILGNKRVHIVDIPGGGTTSDLIVVPMRAAQAAFANFRGSTAGSSSAPVCTVDGTTVTINQLAATTAASYTVTVIGI